MTPLEQEIRTRIESEGPMPVARYMALCLERYYASRDPFGAAGDFVTAPEVSQMFGEMIGLWCAVVWNAMGAPQKLALIELGPGRGTMMGDVLRVSRVESAFHAALEVHLVETSTVLQEAQQKTLAAVDVPVFWHARVDEIAEGPLIVLANEFVDALPIDQVVKTENGWHQRQIGLRDGRLVFGLDPAPLPGIEESLPARLEPAPSGAVLERRDLGPLREIARRISRHGGVALVIDYGYGETAFGDTLQAIRTHRRADPLEKPGEIDLTVHVDFESLAAAAAAEGARVFGPVTQGVFLRRLGIEMRAARLKADKDAQTQSSIDAALSRLTAPAPGMGELFKALAFAHPDLPPPLGFDSTDDRGERQQ